MNKINKHDEYTRLIQLNPKRIGLENIILSLGEANLFQKERIVSQPDNLLFDSQTNTLYNVEYKCHDNKSQGHHAEYQLRRAESFLKRIFPTYRIVNLYIHDDYKIEVL